MTEADHMVEEKLRERIARKRPGYAVVGEEFGGAEPGDARFVLDPIDGTRNFVRGIPIWGSLIALELNGETAVAVASAPALGHRWWAILGGGAYADGKPIEVSTIGRIEDAFFSFNSTRSFDELGLTAALVRLARRSWAAHGLSDFWQYMLVAEGALDFALESALNVWDFAAPALIVAEAGGRCTDLSGAPPSHLASFVASNGRLHEDVLAALAEG